MGSMLRTEVRLALVAAAFVAAGCSESKTGIDAPSQQVALTGNVQQDSATSGTGGATSGGCTSKTACPPVAADVSAGFASSGALLGLTNQAVNWEFHGVDKNTENSDQQSSTRNVAVLLDKIPAGAQISPAPGSGPLTTDTKIVWTPTAVASGTLDIILRDLDRCAANETPEFCNQYSFHSDYDTRMAAVKWQIADAAAVAASAGGTDTEAGTGNVIKVGDPTCGANATTDGQVAVSGAVSFATLLLPGGIMQLPNLLGGLLKGPAPAPKATQC